MSWSFSYSGTPDEIAGKFDSYANSLSGDSRVECDAARPSIGVLLGQNFVVGDRPPPYLDFSAYGSGTFKDGQPVSRSCVVRLEPGSPPKPPG